MGIFIIFSNIPCFIPSFKKNVCGLRKKLPFRYYTDMNRLLNATYHIMIHEDEDLIPLKEKTINKLKKIGKSDQTYDDIVIELLDHCNICDCFWSDRF